MGISSLDKFNRRSNAHVMMNANGEIGVHFGWYQPQWPNQGKAHLKPGSIKRYDA